jgi:hypothetical protein
MGVSVRRIAHPDVAFGDEQGAVKARRGGDQPCCARPGSCWAANKPIPAPPVFTMMLLRAIAVAAFKHSPDWRPRRSIRRRYRSPAKCLPRPFHGSGSRRSNNRLRPLWHRRPKSRYGGYAQLRTTMPSPFTLSMPSALGSICIARFRRRNCTIRSQEFECRRNQV